MKSPLYLGLIHYPIYNRNKEVVATAITNFDIHDIARAARTYDVSRYFVVHPAEKQQELVQDMLDYWQKGFGSTYNPDRKNALSILNLVDSLEKAKEIIREETGQEPLLVGTDAGEGPKRMSYIQFREAQSLSDSRPVLLLFGTGWGMTEELMDQLDVILEPIRGRGDFNHLSVRAAVAIILDRLLGETWWENS